MVSKVTVWIRLPGIPHEYWKRDMVIEIASKVGKPIVVDVKIEKLLKGAFTRACIKVDLTKPLVVGAIVGDGEEIIF